MQFHKVNSRLMLIFACITLLFLLSATVIFVVQYTERQLAFEDSEAFTSIIDDVQTFYSDQIVHHAKANNIKIARDYKKEGAAIPFPATFTHNLIATLNKKYKDLNFHFYSDVPFYSRPGGGARDDFERHALTYFRKTRKDNLVKIETSDGAQTFRFAKAIWMKKTCVGCHNSHPDSPLTNWKVGDLRGAHSIKIALTGFSLMKNQQLNPLIIIIVSLYSLVGFCIFMLFFTARKLMTERNQRKLIKDQNRELKSAKSRIERCASYDMVTDLPNRNNFYSFVEDEIAFARANGTGFCVMVIDLDHFKNVNDRYGHSVGDCLLKSVGKKLEAFVGRNDIAARLSGDEFAICIHRQNDVSRISDITKDIIETFDEPTEVDNIQITTNISIGISRYPFDGQTSDDMISSAGLALNKAKNAGRQKCWFFDSELQKKVREDDRLEIDLKSAISKNELDIFYQPKVNLKTGEIEGFEALIRWPHAAQGFISPEDFLPIAEERGLIIPVSRYVAQRVAYDMATWLDKKILKGRIAVNVHAHQLKSLEEMNKLISIFEEYNIPPEYLTLEITEGCVMGRGAENTLSILEDLSAKGIKLSLDDFGTGFASLTHLKNLPVQEVKIDKSFLNDITTNRESEAIVAAIIELSKKIGLEIVAEGIENQDQLQKMIDMDCDIGQGFIFAPPSMMAVANGLLSIPNLFRDVIDQTRPKPVFEFHEITDTGS